MNWLSSIALGVFLLLAGMSIQNGVDAHHFTEKLAGINQQHQEELAQLVPTAQYERVVNDNTRLRIGDLYGGLHNGRLEQQAVELRHLIRQLRTENRICENRSA